MQASTVSNLGSHLTASPPTTPPPVDGVLRGKYMVRSSCARAPKPAHAPAVISPRRSSSAPCPAAASGSAALSCACLRAPFHAAQLTPDRLLACAWRSGWDMHDAVYPRELLISNRANGYKDLLARIDLATYRRIPWEGGVPFFLVSFLDPDTQEPICADPRGVLRTVTERAAGKGYQCYAGCEYEVRSVLGEVGRR